MADLALARLLISGRVQGVGFRYWTLAEAQRLGLSGFVRNLPDRRVEVEAAGERRRVEEFIAWCYRGPPSARVENVEVGWRAYGGELSGFEITD